MFISRSVDKARLLHRSCCSIRRATQHVFDLQGRIADCEDLFFDDDEEVPVPAPHNHRNLNGFAVREALIAQLFIKRRML